MTSKELNEAYQRIGAEALRSVADEVAKLPLSDEEKCSFHEGVFEGLYKSACSASEDLGKVRRFRVTLNCSSCQGSGQEPTGTEHAGVRELVACEACEGRGFS